MPETLPKPRTSAKALREEKAKLVPAVRQMADTLNKDKPDFSAEEQVRWDKLNADIAALEAEIRLAEINERVESLESGLRASVGDPVIGRNPYVPAPAAGHDGAHAVVTEAQRCQALQAWASYGRTQSLTAEQEESCHAAGVNPRASELVLKLSPTADYRRLQAQVRGRYPSAADGMPDYRATLGTVPGSAGGYTIPPETLLRQLEVNMLWYGGMRQVAEVIRTASGERLSWPTGDDTTNTGVLLGESASVGTSVDPSFAKVYWDAYKFSSKPVLVPFELLQDAAFDLTSILGAMLGERIGRITNTYYTTGTGAAQPKGLVTSASLGKTAAGAAAITADELLDLVHSVDPAYRRLDAMFMMHDLTWAAVKKLKDSQNRYLIGEMNSSIAVPTHAGSGVIGRDLMLWNFPVVINNDMPQLATTLKTVLFGVLSRYKIRTVGEVRLYRLQERYRDNDQDAFIALLREDGNMLTGGTSPVKYLQQA